MLKTFALTALIFLVPLHGAVLGSNYGFTYGYLDTRDTLYIDGPGGRDLFHLSFRVDVWGATVLNQYGELVAAINASDDPAVIFAIYNLGDFAWPSGSGPGIEYVGSVNGYGSTTPIAASSGFLALPSLPTVPYYAMKAWPVSISDSGLVTAKVYPTFLGGAIPPPNSTAVWQLPNLQRAVMTASISDVEASAVAPEPGTFALAGLCVLALIARRSAIRSRVLHRACSNRSQG